MIGGGRTSVHACRVLVVESVKVRVVGLWEDLAERAIIEVTDTRNAVIVAISACGLVQRVRSTDILLELADGALTGANSCIGPFVVVVSAECAVQVGRSKALHASLIAQNAEIGVKTIVVRRIRALRIFV